MLNMGTIQAKATTMNKQELIAFAKKLELSDEQKQRLWNHWKTVQKLKLRRQK